MKKILSFILMFTTIVSALAIPMTAIDTPSYSMSSFIDLSKAGVSPGDDSAHGNHQTRTVHTSHGDYAAYVTGTYTDSNYQTVNRWSLFKIDPEAGSAKVIFTGEKYYDSSQVSLLVDKDENVWAITSTSDSGRNLSAEGLDCRAHRLDAKTGEITSYTAIIGGGARDGYGYATCFYDPYMDRIIVMHAGGDYKAGSTTGASFNWAIFSLTSNSWQTRVRYARIDARHCYMYGYLDENGGLMLMAQRDIKAASLGYPEIGNNNGLSYSEQQYMKENGITRWSANYCWDQLDLYYFPNITESKYIKYSICEADYSKVTGTQTERYTLAKRLSNYYPAIQNNNGGDFLLTETDDGKKLLHITYNKAYIQAAMDRSVASDSKWYHQVWDVTDGSNAVRLYDGVIVDEMIQTGGFSFRLYSDIYGNVYLISGHNGTLSVYRTEYNGNGGYNYIKVGSTKNLSNAEDLINISSARGGSVTDNKLNVLYMNTDGKYILTQLTINAVDYPETECSHNFVLDEAHSIAATCTEGGTNFFSCSYCNEKKEEATIAKGHSYRETVVSATCTEAGYTQYSCESCTYGYSTVIPATGHSFEGGICYICNEKDPDFIPVYTKGDINGDEKINAIDINIAKRIISGVLTPKNEQFTAADLDGDGQINGFDSNLLSRIVSGID